MLDYLPLDQILFLDIETVSELDHFDSLDPDLQKFWELKAGRFTAARDAGWTHELAASLYEQKAAIFAEFGRVIVISVAVLYLRDGQWSLRAKSFTEDSETELLRAFSQLLNEYADKHPGNFYLCGHNIKEFDIPYLCRRLFINGLPLPGLLNMSGKKPWETPLLDTMEMWKFGDFKNYTSLALLARILGVPGPKEDMNGGDVGRVYWKEKDLTRIAHYCEKDVATVAQIMLRFQGKDLIPEERISSATQSTKAES
ncbi:MAG TPA: 3'-5' exonuclease [Saprospiraceae bacterium]|nr:3'-5' exonuclease [Saprospiraceae bacterium]